MIQLNGIFRTYILGDQTVHALNNVSLSISPGEYISIMGPSGSGKSTLLNVLGLLDKPTKGKYIFNQSNTTNMSDDELANLRQQSIGFIFQFFQLLNRMSALENVELPMMLSGIDAQERKQRATEKLVELGLKDRVHHRPDQLSGGQQQRVAIARATVMHPLLILADEPTGNLDRTSGDEVINILERLNNNGMALIVVTHDPDIGKRAVRKIRMVDGAITDDSQQT